MDGVRFKHNGCSWKVLAKVDAQNGFGAQIRSDYYTEVKYVLGKVSDGKFEDGHMEVVNVSM
ncbi:MAG: hypothetical protein ACLPSW_29595 [Roseiarcus sp.]